MDESSLEHDTQKKDSLDSPLKVLSNLEDSQILEGTENIAPSPFALHNQEVDSDERRGSFEKVDLGEASSEGTEGDSTIVSSIKSAMTQLRAASLPAALIRPAVGSEPEFLEVSLLKQTLPFLSFAFIQILSEPSLKLLQD